MADSDLAIHARGLTKRYGAFEALRGLDLEVRRGEVFGFLGPNGAGKTTTVRCLLDLIRPSGGELSVLGLNPQRSPLEVRRRTGYLPGELHLDERLRVDAALRYLGGLRGEAVPWARIVALAERLHLDLEARIGNLSKGNKQKVGIAQAFMHEPELLLLDEPTGGLDPLMQQEVNALVLEAKARGATVFFSSHILPEVEAVSERVAIVRKGVVVETAHTADLVQRAVRRATVRFKEPVDPGPLGNIPGVSLLDADAGDPADDRGVRLEVKGEMDPLIKALAAYPVLDFDTERPSLEEIFLAYYEEQR